MKIHTHMSIYRDSTYTWRFTTRIKATMSETTTPEAVTRTCSIYWLYWKIWGLYWHLAYIETMIHLRTHTHIALCLRQQLLRTTWRSSWRRGIEFVNLVYGGVSSWHAYSIYRDNGTCWTHTHIAYIATWRSSWRSSWHAYSVYRDLRVAVDGQSYLHMQHVAIATGCSCCGSAARVFPISTTSDNGLCDTHACSFLQSTRISEDTHVI